MRIVKLIATALFIAVTLVVATISVALIAGEPTEGGWLVEMFGLFFGKLIAMLVGTAALWANYECAKLLSERGIIYDVRG